jgi:ZIP family zinc transporter
MILNYLQVILLGILGSISLIIGAFFGYRFNISKKIIAITLAFTTGTLTSAVCFDLLVEAYYYGGFEPMITGFFVGVMIFTLADLILNHFSIKEHYDLKASKSNSDNLDSVYLDSNNNENINNSSFNALKSGLLNVYSHKYKKSFNKYQIESIITIIGALLDGIPESLAIGLILIIGGPISVSLLIAVFIANLFEGISSSRNMKLGGWSGKSIFKVWTFVLILSALSTLFSYTVFSHTDHHILSGALGVAAGALISIIADVLLPDAYSETHEFTGFLMALGLLVSFILSHLNT